MKKIIYLIVLVIPVCIKAQNWYNLIPNYSFEKVSDSHYENKNFEKCLYNLKSVTESEFILNQEPVIEAKNNDTTQQENKSKRHGLFGEAFGGGGYYSIGYEYTIVNRQRYELLGSIGFSSNFKGKPQFDFGLPISFNNRVKFWRFNGIDLGASLGNLINIWAIVNQEKYFNCPLGNCNPKVLFFPSIHIGWYFGLNNFYISPRFYGFINRSINGNGIELSPFFGLRFSYLIK